MLKIAQKVNFIRRDKDDNVVEGEGIVKGIGLDMRNRIVAVVENDGGRYQIHEACIDASDEFKVRYTESVKKILELSKEGTDLNRKVAHEYNAKIDELETAILGARLVFDEPAGVTAISNDENSASEAAEEIN